MIKKTLPSPAELVVKARELSKESQEIFGNRFGKTQSQISKYERGELDPPADIVIHCMTFLGPSTDNLTPKRLAQDIGALDEGSATLALRRAIRDMLQLSKQATTP